MKEEVFEGSEPYVFVSYAHADKERVVPLIQGLQRRGIRENDPERYFNAHLWGADLSAAEDAVVVFYGVERNEAGEIADISFNFVAWEEFRRTYALCDEQGRRFS